MPVSPHRPLALGKVYVALLDRCPAGILGRRVRLHNFRLPEWSKTPRRPRIELTNPFEEVSAPMVSTGIDYFSRAFPEPLP